jgi:hypothetical protein
MGPNTFNSPKLDIEESMKYLFLIIVFIQLIMNIYAFYSFGNHIFHIFLPSACVFSSSVVDF